MPDYFQDASSRPRVYDPNDKNQNLIDFANQASAQYGTSRAGATAAGGRYQGALNDPMGTAGMFSNYITQQAQGITAPAMRDFSHLLDVSSARTASRFGGNASTEEQRGAYNTADLFSRNLSEALARLAPEGAQLGMQYTSQLGDAYRTELGNANAQQSAILAALGGTQQKSSPWASVLGGVVGGGLGFLAGGPAGAAAGYGVGSKFAGQVGASDGSDALP